MKLLRTLWKDEAGAIISSELVLVATILVIGMIVGLAAVRNSVVAELADLAEAIGSIDQSFSFSQVTGHAALTEGSIFTDAPDFCEPGSMGDVNSKCVTLSGPPTNGEGL